MSEQEKNNNQQNNEQIENTQAEDIQPDVSDLQNEEINTRKLQALGVIAFMLVILALVAFVWFSKHKKEEPVKEAQVGTRVQKADLGFKEEKPLKELVLEQQSPFVEEEPAEDNNPFAPQAKAVTVFEPKVFKGSSPMMITNSSAPQSSEQTQTPVDFSSGEYTIDENGKFVKKETKDNNDDKSYDGDVYSPKSAKLNQFDPNLYLAKGTYIGCSLNTRLVSTIKGGISCTVSEDVYSDNGVTLLIEKGSKITGSYRNGQMNDGMDRIFVVWQEIRTPNQVVIPISSGASDELGGAGIQGYVDHHWLQRFGAAILLSVIDDATNVALNGGKGNRNNSNVDYTENSRETTQEMANTALEKFINIEPTLYKNHGDIVGVYVNRDIDFSGVYKLRVQKGIRK